MSAATSDNDGWVEWSGGECPVDPETLVQVKWADPNRLTREALPASVWSEPPFEWSRSLADECSIPGITIIAYRVVSK